MDGRITLTVNPTAPRRFAVRIHVPTRDISSLCRATPDGDGISRIAVNGAAVTPAVTEGAHA